jgi:DNA-binding response OmpR family regulator
VMLPDSTGYQICSRLRQIDAVRNVPIIMMSGVACYPNQKTFAMERGANEYLTKPFQIIEVGDLVNSYLRKESQHPIPKPMPQATPMPELKPAAPMPEPSMTTPETQAPDSTMDEDEGILELRAFLNDAINNRGKTDSHHG